jgi:hypothetical protein
MLFRSFSLHPRFSIYRRCQEVYTHFKKGKNCISVYIFLAPSVYLTIRTVHHIMTFHSTLRTPFLFHFLLQAPQFRHSQSKLRITFLSLYDGSIYIYIYIYISAYIYIYIMQKQWGEEKKYFFLLHCLCIFYYEIKDRISLNYAIFICLWI